MTRIVAAFAVIAVFTSSLAAGEPNVVVATPMSPPAWALMERELLRANSDACEQFFERYFDERGFLLCVERWGGDDGPDDAIENCMHWPVLHALGGSDRVLTLYKKAWEGHLRQYTLAKTTKVPLALDGMYYREFPVMFDWLHNSEGLTVFCMQGLSDPEDAAFRARTLRYAGFYSGEDPAAPNYDLKHRVIKSLFNGSRGPLLRKATALDWAGDPIEIENRFNLGHGERNYQEMLDHFRDYTDVVGDHPSNLASTALSLQAYCVTGDEKYRKLVLDYVDAWSERARANGDILPSNVGLDGKIGGEAGGKWYGGTYGWGFTVIVPQTGKPVNRSTTHLGLSGFLNAYLLTGDDRYLNVWRKQTDAINTHAKTIDGAMQYPSMHGDDGWYAYSPEKYSIGVRDIWLCSMKESDRARVGKLAWADWLEGKNPKYPEAALAHDLAHVRKQSAAIRADGSSPDTRLSDDSMQHNPCSIASLVELAMGGTAPGRNGLVLHSRLRYFDPVARRAGLPEGVAALVERLTADETVVTLVNVNQVERRDVTIQGGGYGEHRIVSAATESGETKIDSNRLTVRLENGAGARLTLKMNRYANRPRLEFPW